MTEITHVDLDTRSLDRMRAVIGDAAFDRLRSSLSDAGTKLNGHTLWNVNSTAEGGGVAEMLSTLLPYCVDAGWNVRWAVIDGNGDFFELTKRIHNALHGSAGTEDDGTFDDAARDVYERISNQNAEGLAAAMRPGDVVLVHDPQAAGVIAPLDAFGARVSWQCHIGTDTPNDATRQAWSFLTPMVTPAKRYVFSREDYLWDSLDDERLRVIPPAIDALSPKNAPLEDEERDEILAATGLLDERVLRDARIVLEVSRWDRLKDPIGFIRLAEHLEDLTDVHLVYAGPSVSGVDDDPEGAQILAAAEEVWRSLAPDVQQRVHLLSLPMDDVDENARIVNALQRRADVIVQKSLEEGFGLTVSEAMWKSKPVVASRVGGIQDQIEHGRSGLLVDDPYDIACFAEQIRTILQDAERGSKLGEAARERVLDRFLGHRMLMQYADLVAELVD